MRSIHSAVSNNEDVNSNEVKCRMMKRYIRCATFIGAVGLSSIAMGAPVIINGDFESVAIGSPFSSTNPADIPGWTHTGTPGDSLLWGVGYTDENGSITTAGHGNQFVTLGGGYGPTGTASWSSSITGLTPGNSYVLSFMMAPEGAVSGAQSFDVSFANGSSTGLQTFTSAAPTGNYWHSWESKQLTFLATDTAADVVFSVTDKPYDVGIDYVQVKDASVVPVPAAVWLFGSGLLGLIGVGRRRSVTVQGRE